MTTRWSTRTASPPAPLLDSQSWKVMVLLSWAPLTQATAPRPPYTPESGMLGSSLGGASSRTWTKEGCTPPTCSRCHCRPACSSPCWGTSVGLMLGSSRRTRTCGRPPDTSWRRPWGPSACPSSQWSPWGTTRTGLWGHWQKCGKLTGSEVSGEMKGWPTGSRSTWIAQMTEFVSFLRPQWLSCACPPCWLGVRLSTACWRRPWPCGW